MPRAKPLAFALILALTVTAPDALAQRKKKRPARAKAPVVSVECGDFYTAVNKEWLAAVPVPAGTASTTALGQLVARSQQQQRDLLDAAMQSPQGNVQKLLGDFWASGLDEAAVEADGAKPITPLLDRINGIRRGKDVPAAIAALHQVGIPVVFNFSADLDLKDLDRHIGYFSQGGTALPDPAFYARQDADTVALMGRYRVYVEKILTLTGTPAERLAADTQAVFDLETRLAQAARPLASLRDPKGNYAPVPIAELKKQYRNLQLAEFIQAQGVSDDVVSIANPALFQQIDGLIRGLKTEQWKTYLRYQVGNAMAPYLSKSFREADFEFRGRVLHGLSAPAPRWRQTLDAINLAAGPMLGREYAARYLPAATRGRAETVAGEIRDALAAGVERNAWMSQAAKAEAKAKLGKLKIEIGTPRRDLDYSIQPMGRGSFGSNMLIASTWRHREEMRRIGRHNATRRWDVLPQQPALSYDLAHNRLIVTAAVLQAPLIDMSQEPSAHYGGFGALVGHELTHAIDARGRNIDAAGEVRDWWTPTDVAGWEGLQSRIGSQFDGYPYPLLETSRVNGRLVRSQALNDLAGIELAQAALEKAMPAATDANRQAFYQAWARLWAQQMGVEAATFLSTTSAEPPGQWRVNGTLANQPGFAASFQCKAPGPLALPETSRIKVW
ncbi:M13 family peptidase [Lysobacter pythonis]|uniref:M13 family peptidase n=1 Tax=Solilutibacter pythonis TaxID=2483112 RepID=A0A3M2I0C7_9GAMM|nr:M13 family metallopeptidase [Lysobacter pythonis]RMH93613.1 M13 family peptidase [Lysobacter pythonis]